MLRGLTRWQLVVGLGVMVVVTAGGYFYLTSRRLSSELTRLKGDSDEVVALVEKVGLLVALPEGEEPVVATVTEKEKLSGQPFFARAENGDKVLIYTGAKKAYLYDPESNRVLEIAPVTIGEEKAATESGKFLDGGYIFAVRNGAGVAGIEGRMVETVKEKVVGAEVVETANAAKTDYQESRLVSFIEEVEAAERVALILGLKLGELPKGEATPAADFLVIVGRDRE